MSEDEATAAAWQAIEGMAGAVAVGWAGPLRAALAGASPGIWTGGWWSLDGEATLFGLPAQIRLAVPPSAAGAALFVRISGYVAPSAVFGGLMFGGADMPTALDFFGLTDPVVCLSSLDGTAPGFGAWSAVQPGLTLTGVVPDTTRLDAVPRALTRPLKYLLDDTHALPAGLTLHVGSQAATALVEVKPPWTPLDTPGLKMTLSKREIGVQLARSGGGAVPARDAPRTTARDGSRQKAQIDRVTMRTDVDLVISLAEGLPFPEDDTARFTLGAEVSGGKDGQGDDARAEGWLQLRPEASPWHEPFGLPSARIDALFGRVDLAKKALRAFRGRGAFAGQGFDVGLVLAPKRSDCLVALRNDDDVSLLGIGAALLGREAGSIPAPALKAQPPRVTDPAADVDPDDYTVYFSQGTQQFDGKTWPPGLRIRGTVAFWSLIEAGVDLGVTWGEGPVEMAGSGLSLRFAGVGVGIDMGGLLGGLPLRIEVSEQLELHVEADYRLSLGGYTVDGTVRLGPGGATFDLPGNGGIWRRDPDIGLTGITADGLSALRIDAFVARTLSLTLPGGPLPGGLAPLPAGVIEAVGELHFAVDVARTPSEVGAGVTRLVGRIPALGLEKQFDVSALHVDVGQLQAAGALIESTVREWAEQAIADLFGDLFGQIPVLGPLLRDAYGLADEAVGRLFAVAGDVPGLAGTELKSALEAAGVALDEADRVLAHAMDWARANAIGISAGVGGWAIGGLNQGLNDGLALMNEALSAIPGFNETLGEAGKILGGLFGKKHDDAPGAEAREKASQTAAAGGVAVLYQQRELGGEAFSLPLGRYPQMPGALRPDGDGDGANSMVLPRGWTARVWSGEGFTGESSWFDVTTNDMGDWVDRARSVEIMLQGKVMFFSDSYYRDRAHEAGSGDFDRDRDHWLRGVSSIMVPTGFEVDLWNTRGAQKVLTSSTHSVGWLFGDHWNDRIQRAVVRQVGIPPKTWQTSSAVAWGSADQWVSYAPQEMVRFDVDLRPYGFTRPPRVFTTLTGAMAQNAAYGVNAIYPTPTGFSVYVGLPGQPVPLDTLKQAWRWRLSWVAFADDAPMLTQGAVSDFPAYGGDGYGLFAVAQHAPARVDGQAAPAFTSLCGASSSAFVTGSGATYNASETGLAVYLRGGLDRFDGQGGLRPAGAPIDPAKAAGWGWRLDWCRPLFGRAGITHGGTRLHADRTAPGAGWQPYGADGLTLRVDTADLALPEGVIFVTAISGHSRHWTLTGGSAVYEASPAGFRIYVRHVDGAPVSPAQARADGWHVHWMAIAAA